MRIIYHKKFFFICISQIYFFAISCSSFSGSKGNMVDDHEKRLASLESSIVQLKFQETNLEQDNTLSKKTLSSLQNDIQSQSEEIATQKKNIAILNRGLRSGIFEELPEDKYENSTKNTTMLPNFVNGRTGFTENSELNNQAPTIMKENREDPIGPKELLANAEIKIRKSDYKEGLIKLDEMKKKFPNYDDNGRSFLLSAEAWLKLKEYDNVIPELRNFYLKYPTNADLAYAKLLEGQANEGNGQFERAAELYNEVISLSPQSTLSQTARDGMLRMRDQK